jgi:hypothetical protein
MWLLIIIALLVLLQRQPAIGMIATIIYVLYLLLRKSPAQENQTLHKPIQAHKSSGLNAGDLADLVLLRLELQALVKQDVIDSEQQAELTQRIDALCTQHLANLAAVRNNDLWRKRCNIAWELLNQYADTPLGLPPWRFAKPQEADAVVTTPSDFSEPITSTLSEAQPISFATETTSDLSSNAPPSEQIASVTVSEIPIPTVPLANEAIQFKENEQHGDWLISLERISLEQSVAHRLMQAQPTNFTAETEADLINNTPPSEQTASVTVSEIPIPAAPLANETQPTNVTPAKTFTIPDIPIPATPLAESKTSFEPQPASLIVETDFSTPITSFATDINSDSTPSEQAATFAIDTIDHAQAPPYQAASLNVKKPEPTLNQYAWKPHEPTRLERVLKTVSGWHSMAVPFLAQNIGWFIGVFCFIAGSGFLVHYTKGYASNLIAFFAFFIFTLALLFGGYQLRHKRPELEVSSTVIFILSLLLIPLTTITGTQLLMTSDGSILKLLFSGLLVLIELGVFYFAVTLVSGLMDRSLQQGLPRFFLALTATQLLQVLLLGFPFWLLLLVIHLLIFALLSTGIYLFVNQWLQSIFVDRHKISCVAAGTLIYAAVVSFVFISVGNPIALPEGYYGFFLLLLCGLLFFIDVQLKQWTEQYTYLSRFSFFIYGLSVLALCMVAQYQIAIPTLVLAIALYAFIVWRYLTLTPLTILLVCYFWLYSLLVLQHLPYSWHFLASLPVLLSLYKAAHWALNKRESAYLAVIVYRVLYGLLAVLTIWSLYHSEAGLLAMATAITASILIYYTLKAAPIAIFSSYSKLASAEEDVINRLSKKHNLLNSHWFYTIPALDAVTIYYTPRFLPEQTQFSLGLLLLSVFWAYRGLRLFFKAHSTSDTTPIELRLNSALLSLLVGVLALFPLWMTDKLQLVAPLLLVAIILLWLSYQLLTRWLFYLALIAVAVAFMPIRAIYFPTPSGLVTMLMGISIWFWLWYAERQESSELITLKREQVTQKIALLPSCRLLGRYRLPSPALLFRDVINTPLEQVMCLFWLLGMKTLYMRFYYDELSYAWLAAVFLAGLFSLLLIVRYLLIKLLPVPIALVLTAVLMMLKFWGLNTDGLLLASALFALAFWRVVNYSLTQAFFIKLVNTFSPALPSEIQEIGKIIHHSAFFIVLASVILQLLNAADTHSFIVFLTLITTAGFLWLSDSVYQQLIVRYLVLGFSVLAGIELVSLTLYSFAWQALITDSYAALLFTLLSLAVAVLVLTPTTTYTKPAAVTAISLVFAGIFLQIQYVINIAGSVVTPLDYTVLFLASISLLLANAKYKWTAGNFSAFMIFALAVLWLENSIFHAQQPFSLWLGTQTFPDLWLALALLSLAMSLLSHKLRVTQKVDVCYLPPLNTVATLCFVWGLLGTLTLFFAHKPELLAWSFACLLLALFSLTKNRTGAEQIRGFASATLLTLIVFSLLPSFSQTATVIMGYALWCCASFVLPRFNKRFSDWTIAPIFFPYLGFLLLVFSCFWMPLFNEFSAGIYCLELSVYSLLMLRYSRWMIFSWLATLTFTAAVLWLENSLVNTESLNLSFGEQTIADSWLMLGLLSLAMSALSHKLKATQKWAELHCLPLNTVATLNFVWSLTGTLTLFFAMNGQADLLAWSFLVLLLALFSLTKNRSGAEQIRGFASASLLAFTVFSVLRADSVGFSLQAATVTTGYTLWCCASLILPNFNKRFSDWAIDPLFFPYSGFLLLVLASYWYQPFNDVNMGTYSLALSVYSLLMLRYSRWMIFSWLSTLTFAAAVLWLENSVVADKPLLLSFGEQHSWLVLGLLSLAMSLLAHKLKATQKWAELHCLPLNTVATVCFVGSLFGTLTVFFANKGQAGLLAGSFACLLLALFSLTKNRSSEAESRGFGSACLLTLTAFSLLRVVGLDGFELQSATVSLGYALWLFASFALPPFNKRYRDWTIEPLFSPYLGFLLVAFSGCWWQSFNDFNIGIYCLELTIYCVLMWRYSQAMMFAWLASFAVVGAMLWLENSVVHPHQPLSLLLGEQKLVDSWLVLGLLSLSLSVLSHRLKAWQTGANVYSLPLSSVATLCFFGSLLGTLTLFFMSSEHSNFLAGILLVLLLASFSLSKDNSNAAQIRGFASACLVTLAVFNLLPAGVEGFALQTTTALYGYTLWLFATVILPRFNQRYSAWTIAPDFFPWLGLLLVMFSAAWWQQLNTVEMGIYCLELSVYCLLMLRYNNGREFSWLSAFTFTAAGVFFFNIDNDFLSYNLLLWSNLQLLIATFWQRKGEKLAERWQWQSPPLAQAFTNTAQFIFVSYLLIISIAIGALLVYNFNKPLVTSVDLLLFVLINLSFLHLLRVRFPSFSLHCFIYSLFLSVWAIYFTYLNRLFHPPLLLALWSVGLLVWIRIASPTRYKNEIAAALTRWLTISLCLATVALLTYSADTLGELLLSLAIVTGLSAAVGWSSIRSTWLVIASIELLLLLHLWPFLLVNVANVDALLPWYALQITLFACLSTWLLTRLSENADNTEHSALYANGLRYTSWLTALGLLELGGHGVLIQQSVMTGASANWLLPPFDALAALSTGIIISIIGLRHIRHTPNSNWLYGIVMLIGALAFYSRLLWLGAASVTLWDTAAIIGFAYILFFLQGLFPSKPLYNMALLMPALALFTVLHLEKPETSMTLIVTGLLYVMMCRHSQQKIPLYLALLAFNAGVYLWIPSLAKDSELYQVYVIPAALSVLILLHLHSRELKPSVLMGSRLAAVSSIYACATADVFLRDQNIIVFILAMGLSIAGILLGIALRTRAFLYAGVSFLLLNVIGQALSFYPKQGLEPLSIAIVLMVMGTVIISVMIWFNIKRVAILQRISVIQAEMQTWE